MGNSNKKILASSCNLLTADEQKIIAATFRIASNTVNKSKEDELIVSGPLDADSLEKYWGPMSDPRLSKYLINFLFGFGPKKAATVDFYRFAELYVYSVRGDPEERLLALYNSLGREYDPETELPYQLLREYCETMGSTYMKIIKKLNVGRSWTCKGFMCRPTRVQMLGEALVSTITQDETTPTDCTSEQLRKWMSANLLMQQITETVFINLYGLTRHIDGEPPPPKLSTNMPRAQGIHMFPDYPAFVDLPQIAWLNHHLPLEYQHKWRFIFSTHVHGESFTTLVGRAKNQGPSVLIIEDTDGHIFGGYAPVSWAIGPNFYGTPDCFLFTLAPKMRCYDATSFNDHYMYLNQHTRTMRNGIIMGGQFEMPGIWVDASFGEGYSADTCITFRGYKRLSKENKFRIKSLELWGIGNKPNCDTDSIERDFSVLDTNPDVQAILEMAGRSRHSEGFRMPPIL